MGVLKMNSWRRVWGAFFLAGVLTSSCPAKPVRAEVAKPSMDESGSLIVTADTTEVREGPSRGYAVITIVGKGEIFVKEGRTGAWYYIRINGDTFGWINGRDVVRYQAEGVLVPDVAPEEEAAPYLGPYDARYYPYYPGSVYGYSYYAWGQPSLSWEWYYYGSDSHRYRTWDYDSSYRRDRDHDRSRDESWRTYESGRRESNTLQRSSPSARPFGPRNRGPFRRR